MLLAVCSEVAVTNFFVVTTTVFPLTNNEIYKTTITYLWTAFYPRDAMLARVIVIATCLSVRLSVCPSVRPSVRPSRAGIVSKRRKLAA